MPIRSDMHRVAERVGPFLGLLVFLPLTVAGFSAHDGFSLLRVSLPGPHLMAILVGRIERTRTGR